MSLVYFDPLFLEHDPGDHPEHAKRLRAIVDRFEQLGLFESGDSPTWNPATDQQIGRVHTRDYIEKLRAMVVRGGGRLDADTVVSERSFDAAAHAAGAVCDAVDRVSSGTVRHAFCLSRPPGHHALPSAAMGFCILNHIAIAARHALDRGAKRVLIVDFDVHHGNGTQDIFYDCAKVGFLSMHRSPFWPQTGASDEWGSGPGKGANRNLPVEFGTPVSRQLQNFADSLNDFADSVRPDVMLVSAGFDAHRDDPVGSLDWQTEDFATVAETIRGVADRHTDGRTISVLEGGYHPRRLAESAAVYWEAIITPPSGLAATS